MTPPADCVELLRAMVRFDTVTPSASGRPEAEGELGAWLADFARRWGFQTQALPVAGEAPNILITCQCGHDAPWLLLDSHLDTVGVEGMTIDPFGADLRDGRVWGRGAADTKGTGAAMLWALRESAAAGTLAWNVAVLLSVGEEHLQPGAQSFATRDLPNLGWSPWGVVVGEPTGMQVVAAANGYVRARVVTRGVAAHSSTPERGRNAIVDMARVIDRLQTEHIDRRATAHPLTGVGSCSINLITGGAQINVVPEHCELRLDQRITPDQTTDGALAEIAGVLDRMRAEDPALRVSIEGAEIAMPLAHDHNRAVAVWASEALRAAGCHGAIVGAPYTTNANRFARFGLRCVIVGPGDIAQAHTAEESIGLEELHAGVCGYRALIETPTI